MALAAAGLVYTRCGRARTGSAGAAAEEGSSGGGAGSRAGQGARAGGVPGAQSAALPAWFGRPGAPDRRIAGRVTFEGEPVDGAEVRLWSYIMLTGVLAPVVVKTGADGRFDLGVWPASSYQVGASSPGRASAVESLDLADPSAKPPSDQLELRLTGCAASMYGRVVDAAGSPIQGALVRRDRVIGVATGADGAYDLCLPKGSVSVYVEAEGYGGVVLTMEMIGRIRRDVVLVPEATIVGRVVRRADGSPVPGAAVHAWTRDHGRERVAEITTLAGADGRFQIGRIGPGRYGLWADTDTLILSAGVDVFVEVGKTSDEVTLVLDDASIVRGRVVAAGKPVAGVRVQAVRNAPSRRSLSGWSQPDGSFVLTEVPRGEVTFIAFDHEVISPKAMLIDRLEHDGVVVEVEKMAAIRGRVTRHDKPVGGAKVQASRFSAVAEPNGSYVLAGLPPGEYEVFAHSRDAGAFTDKRSVKVTLERGAIKEGIDIELDGGGRISGVVVDDEGRPVEGVHVRWQHVTTGDRGDSITAADGSYACDSMTGGGEYRATVRPNDGPVAPLPPAKGEHPMVRLEDGDSSVEGVRLAVKLTARAIAGRVVDTAGQPLADARVLALAVEAGKEPVFNTWLQLPSATTDVDGSFTLRDLPDGRYALMARGVAGGEGVVKDVAAGSANVRIVVALPGWIDGELIGYSETPVVYATATTGQWRLLPGVIEGTTFRIRGLPAGKYLVTGQTVHEGDAATVEVRSGVASRVTLTSQGSGTIEGTYRELAGEAPIVGAICQVVASAEGFRGVTNFDPALLPRTGADGSFVLQRAPAGTTYVTCSVEGTWQISYAAKVVEVPRGGVATVALTGVRYPQDGSTGNVGLDVDWRQLDMVVQSVRPGGPAARAGILPGDRLTAFNGLRLDGVSSQGFYFLVAGVPIGQSAPLSYRRGGAEEVTVVVTVDPPPAQ